MNVCFKNTFIVTLAIQKRTIKSAQFCNLPMAEREIPKSQKRKSSETPQLDLAKIRRGAKKLRPGFDQERYNETEYYFQNGLRKVYPYFYTFTTFAKGRWVGKLITEVFSNEFRAYPISYYEKRMKQQRFLVNNSPIDASYIIKDNDMLANTIHRHEVPVLGSPIKIIHKDDGMLVIDKPPSVPVHPCGRYRHNTIIFILAKEYGIHDLHTLHRLDRLTSGLLMFARNLDRARIVMEMMRERTLKKEYLCRVEGEFPLGERIECNAPVGSISHKIGVCGVLPTGRECLTYFTRLSYNGRSSVVLCEPKQGRMHQIRVHLQYLGFPIVNDPIYNDTVFGPEKGKGGIGDICIEELVEKLMQKHSLDSWFLDINESSAMGPEPTAVDDSAVCVTSSENANDSKDNTELAGCDKTLLTGGSADADNDSNRCAEASTTLSSCANDDPLKGFPKALHHYIDDSAFQKDVLNHRFDLSKVTREEDCKECTKHYIEPRPSDLFIYLHCYRYSGEDFSYEASYPNWAKEDWNDD